MNTRFLITFIIPLLCLPASASAENEGGLVNNMSDLQTWMHKTALSLDANNVKLVYFYTHELEETIEALEDVGEYKSYNIADLTKRMLVPEFEKFEEAVKAKKIEEANAQFKNLVGACNQCHEATGHGFIKIKRTANNPFMQGFDN